MKLQQKEYESNLFLRNSTVTNQALKPQKRQKQPAYIKRSLDLNLKRPGTSGQVLASTSMHDLYSQPSKYQNLFSSNVKAREKAKLSLQQVPIQEEIIPMTNLELIMTQNPNIKYGKRFRKKCRSQSQILRKILRL